MKKHEVSIADLYTLRLGVVWLAIKQEHISFWLTCGYLVFEYVRPQSIYTWLDILPWAQICVLGAIGSWAILPRRKWVGNFQSGLLISYFVVIVLSCMFGFSPSSGYDKLSEFVAWILIYFMIINIVNTRKRFFLFYLLFLLASYKMSQHGFLSWARRGFSFSSWGVSGAPGWFQNSGEFGIQLTIYVPMAFAFIFAYRDHWGKWTRYFFYSMPFTGLASVVATSSRGAQLAMTIVAGWFTLKSKYRFRALIGVVLVGSLLWGVMPEEQVKRITSSGEDNTSKQRLIYWGHGLDILQSNPFLGVGYCSWIPYYKNHWPNDVPFQGVELPHNIFVQAGAELGFSGLFLYVAMILGCFVLCNRIRKMSLEMGDRASEILAVGMNSALIGFLISGSFISVLYYPYFWLHLSMVVSFYSIVKNDYLPFKNSVEHGKKFGKKKGVRKTKPIDSELRS